MSTWSDELQCRWECWSIPKDGWLRLDLPSQNCCDMNGAIQVAKGLMPHVRVILTYSGGEMDTAYIKIGKGWEARRIPKSGIEWRTWA